MSKASIRVGNEYTVPSFVNNGPSSSSLTWDFPSYVVTTVSSSIAVSINAKNLFLTTKDALGLGQQPHRTVGRLAYFNLFFFFYYSLSSSYYFLIIIITVHNILLFFFVL